MPSFRPERSGPDCYREEKSLACIVTLPLGSKVTVLHWPGGQRKMMPGNIKTKDGTCSAVAVSDTRKPIAALPMTK